MSVKASKKRAPQGSGLRPLQAPVRTTAVLSNGLTVHFVPRGQLPLVSVRLVLREGSARDSRPGLTDFTMRLLRRGAAGRTADEISEQVDFVAASLGAWAGEDAVGVSLQTPSQHLETLFGLLAQVITQPDFPEKEVELARRRTLAQLSNELDDPGSIAERAIARALWGDHPYGREAFGLRKSIETLDRASMVARHRELFVPAHAALYLVGDVDPNTLVPALEQALGGWNGPDRSLPPLPGLERAATAGRVTIIDKPDQTQVQFRLAARGIPRGHVDQIPLGVANAALGGVFTSRLMREIRVKRGLSYGAGCHFETLKAAGGYYASSFTKTESIGELIEIARREIDLMRTKGPTAKELATVERYLAGLYPTRLETNDAIAGALADIDTYGLPHDWIERYRDRVISVTAADAARAAAAHLPKAEDATIVLVGNAKAIEPQAKAFGEVHVLAVKDLE